VPSTEVVTGRLDPATVAEVRTLVAAVADADGVAPMSEHALLHLRHGGEPSDRNLLLRDDDGALAGFAHVDVSDPVDGPSAELAVAPDHRRHGLGRLLGAAVLATADDADPAGRLRLWAHGGLSAAHGLAASLGLVRTRVLLQLRRSLLGRLPAPHWPPGVAVRTFRPGVDDQAWLQLNARAFADHPEQGSWTAADLGRRMAEPWFDPAGFFVAERDGRLVGFHWTKIHGGDSGAPDHGHDPLGEVYVVGVDPDEHGLGLGRALTLAGLRHLRGRGLSQAMLYVDATNTAAVRLYESLGFTRWDTDVLYTRPPGRPAPPATGPPTARRHASAPPPTSPEAPPSAQPAG
jgi:mycothiol synthase